MIESNKTINRGLIVGLCVLVAAIFVGSFAVAGPMASEKPIVAYDPMLVMPNGHYTEYNLTHNIVPNQLERIKLPKKISKDVTLTKITAGPGSVVSNYFSISKSLAKVHSAIGVVKYICANKNLRKDMVDRLDNYVFIYYVGNKHLYTAEVNTQKCLEYGY